MRDILLDGGFKNKKNFAGSVRATMLGLFRKGEIERKDVDGELRYFWIKSKKKNMFESLEKKEAATE